MTGDYIVYCAGCKCELFVTITGAYLGTFDHKDCWCDDCGYCGELLD